MSLRRVLVCLLVAVLVSPVSVATAAVGRGSGAATPEPARVTVTATRTVAVAAVLTFDVRVENVSQHRLTHLMMGNSLVVAGDPENNRAVWSPSLRRCGAALGTAYCRIRDLRPGAVRNWTVRVRVPRRIGGPSGPITAGKTVVLEAFLRERDGGRGSLSNVGRRSVRVVRTPSRLPFTGVPAGSMLAVAVLALVAGAGLILTTRMARSSAVQS